MQILGSGGAWICLFNYSRAMLSLIREVGASPLPQPSRSGTVRGEVSILRTNQLDFGHYSPMTLSLFPVFSCGLSQFTCLRLSFPARAFKGSSQVVSSSRKPSWPGKPGQGGLPTLAQFTPRYTRTGCTVIHHFATRTPNIRPGNNRIIISVIISDSFWGQNSGLT